MKLENQEKKLVAEIKKSAKNGQMGACKIQAKDLVRTRRFVEIVPGVGRALRSGGYNAYIWFARYIQKFYSMRTQLQAISLRIQTVRSNEQMMQSMKGATSLLGSMNRQMNLPALQRIAMEFEKENDIMDQRQEMMDDAIDDVTGLEDEEEGEEVVKEVLDEIGVDLGQAVRCPNSCSTVAGCLRVFSVADSKIQMGDTPSGLQKTAAPNGRVAEAIGGGSGGGGGGGVGGDDDLQARLDSLRR